MASFYTNISQQGKFLHIIGYNNGKRFRKTIPYKPYLYLPSKQETAFKTLQGQHVERIDFSDIWDAKEFLKRYEDVSGFNVYGLDRWIYTYIHDEYSGTIEFDFDLIKTVGIDIEVDTEDGNPDIELANREITAITYRLRDKRIAFGYGEYTPTNPNIKYIKCKNEKDLLGKFLALWNAEEWMPDIVTGWYIDGFDIPYIVNRITQVLSKDDAKRLSPLRILREKKVFMKGRMTTLFTPVGIAILDYQRLYKKFETSKQSSYTLNNIAHKELNEKKLDYSEYEGLADLYKKNHQKFMDYNIRDVDLIFKLEDKLHFIELMCTVAYDAKVNPMDAFTSVLLWDIIIYNYLMDRNIVLPQSKHNPEREFEGAFVKDPLLGLHEWVMSVDLTSLYPHIIIQYNISPETFVKKVPGINIEKCLNEPIDPEVYAMTPNGCCFRKDFQGFLPALMELQFKIRRDYQAKMRKENDPIKKIKYDKAQYAKKIQLNSLYGSLANLGSRWYDADFAEAITFGGQLSILFIAREVNELMNTICHTTDVDYIIAIDTDSLYINFKTLIDHYSIVPSKAVDFLDKIAEEKLVPFMVKKYKVLAEKMNAYKNAMIMKREAIADKALWVAKKHYIMNVWDQEGERYSYPKLKILGIETVRSSTPQICRDALEEAISLVMNKNEKELQKYIETFKGDFFQAPFDEIAFPRGVNNLEKYRDSTTIYRKRSPIHVRGSLLYNNQLKERNIKNWMPIFSGDKIKFVYLKMPNPIHDNVLATPGFLPFKDVTEFIDYHTQWEKSFIDPLNSIISLIGWNTKKEDTLFE